MSCERSDAFVGKKWKPKAEGLRSRRDRGARGVSPPEWRRWRSVVGCKVAGVYFHVSKRSNQLGAQFSAAVLGRLALCLTSATTCELINSAMAAGSAAE